MLGHDLGRGGAAGRFQRVPGVVVVFDTMMVEMVVALVGVVDQITAAGARS